MQRQLETFLCLPDAFGGHVSTWSEEYRHACECWWLKNHTDKQGYLELVLRKRGRGGVDRLVAGLDFLLEEV